MNLTKHLFMAGLAACALLAARQTVPAQEATTSPQGLTRPYLAPNPVERTWDLRDNTAERQRSAYRGEFGERLPYNRTPAYEPRAYGDYGYGAINQARLERYRSYDDWRPQPQPYERYDLPNRRPIDYDDTHVRSRSWYDDTRDRWENADLDDDFPDPRPRAYQSYGDHYESGTRMLHQSYLYPGRGSPYTEGMHWHSR